MSARRPGMLWAGAAIVAVVVIAGAFAPLIAPYDPRAPSGPSLVPPSAHHLLGTNDAGQDLFSQLVWGARAALVVALPGAALAVAFGTLVGAAAGLAGGRLDALAMRTVDVFLALPALPLLILIAALAGPSRLVITVVIALAGWPGVARVIRSQTLSLRERGFVRAARGFGGGPLYVMRRHVVPAVAPLVAASFVDWSGQAVGLHAGLAFLGLGDPTQVSWGSTLNRALGHQGIYFTSAWTWWVLPAGFAVTFAVVGLAFVGVGLEPRFNPRWSRA